MLGVFNHKVLLTPEDVGIIKLMILNDVMAIISTRYDQLFGQSHDKNMQRFFPKSERQQYVHALAQAKIGDDALKTLRAQLSGARKKTLDAFVAAFDPKTVRVTEINEKLVGRDKEAFLLLAALVQSGEAKEIERKQFFNLVFGADRALLVSHFDEVSGAYTQQTGEAKHTDLTGIRTTVVSSMSYATVDPATEPGAVYELRDREIALSENDRSQMTVALDILFRSAQ